MSAYNRLARRYPLQQFPDRHTRLNEAKSVLLNPETGFKEILTESDLDISWLNQYSTKPVPDNADPVDPLSNPRQSFEVLMRPHIQYGVDSLIGTDEMDFTGKFRDILKYIDPDELERMHEEFMKF